MGFGMIATLAVAAAELIIGSAISDKQMKDSEQRAARDTYVRSIYQAVQDRFGVTIDQLQKEASKLDINLSRLTESARGSARLSTASKKLRDFAKRYPQMIDQINQTQDVLNKAINNLSAKKEAASSAITNRQRYPTSKVLGDIAIEAKPAMDAIGKLNTTKNSMGSEGDITLSTDNLPINKDPGEPNVVSGKSVQDHNQMINTGLTLRTM